MADAVREAIAARLAASPGVTDLLAMKTRGIFHRRAPQAAKPPMVVFDKRSGVPHYNFGGELAMDDQRWLVRGVAFGRTADRAEDIAKAIDAALTDAPLVISGRSLMAVYRETDVDYPEAVGPELFQHAGAIYRVASSPAG